MDRHLTRRGRYKPAQSQLLIWQRIHLSGPMVSVKSMMIHQVCMLIVNFCSLNFGFVHLQYFEWEKN